MMMSDLIERLKRQHERVRDPYAIKKESSIFSEAIVLIEQQQNRIAELERYKKLSDAYLDIYNCKKCNGLVNRGYTCFECGDDNPSEFASQLREQSDD